MNLVVQISVLLLCGNDLCLLTRSWGKRWLAEPYACICAQIHGRGQIVWTCVILCASTILRTGFSGVRRC